MIGSLWLIICGALTFYRADKAAKEGNEKIAKILKIIGGISIAAGVILGIALFSVSYM